ncbi:kelch repeat and BTB domain-containing protein 3-like [Planococcus citri]|uniref:kelch repeat and BTB domain-containing protein 3-like n=1 Tax=Planococcus citri TaxID=170843 RepID=UPI0031F976C1
MADTVETIHLDQMETKSSQHINDLRLENLFCDVCFNVNGTIMPCHRLVLAAASPYFKTMFNGNFKESNSGTITINDIETETFEEILNAVYTANIRLHPSNAYFILRSSHLLQLEIIEDACVSYIIKNPKINYLIDACVFARNINKDELFFTCVQSIVANVVEYAKTDSFENIPIDVLQNILSRLDIKENEEESIILLIMKWVKENKTSRKDTRMLLHTTSLKTTKLMNSSVMCELLITCDDKRINADNKHTPELDCKCYDASLPLNLYLNVINVKTGQLGWSVLKMSGDFNKYVLSPFYPTNSCRKKVCRVGTKLYCFEYFEYMGCRNVFSYFDEDGVRIFLSTPPDVLITQFEIAAMGTSIFLMVKTRFFSIWLYECERDTWQNILPRKKHENIYCNVIACTFSDGIFYVVARRNKATKNVIFGSQYYIFSITCRALIVRLLAKIPARSYECSFIHVYDDKIAISGANHSNDIHDKFLIFDLLESQWLAGLKEMNEGRVNFRLFHYNSCVYAVENGRAMIKNEKYDCSSNKWVDLPHLPKRITVSDMNDVVATGEVFGVEVNP